MAQESGTVPSAAETREGVSAVMKHREKIYLGEELDICSATWSRDVTLFFIEAGLGANLLFFHEMIKNLDQTMMVEALIESGYINEVATYLSCLEGLSFDVAEKLYAKGFLAEIESNVSSFAVENLLDELATNEPSLPALKNISEDQA